MKLGFIGLGKMGKAMVLRLLEQGVDVVVYNRTKERTHELCAEFSNNLQSITHNSQQIGNLIPTYSISEIISKLKTPRIIWLMVPHGTPVDEMIDQLIGSLPNVSIGIHLGGVSDRTPLGKLEVGDIIIDGGNSFYKDSVRRYELLKAKGINYLDIGTSGGLEGARSGACLMVGGDAQIYKKVEPILKLAAMQDGVAYFGPAGAGHFVKMVHNGVEYGMLQAIGEGFEMLSKGMPVTKPFARAALARLIEIDLHKVAQNWSHGSVVRGWLMELLVRALKNDPRLENIEGVVGGGSTGEWTIATAKELKVETPVIEKSLEARKKSIDRPTFSGKVVAALRNQFGGHEVKKAKI